MNRARSRSLTQRGGIAGSRDKVSKQCLLMLRGEPESDSGLPILAQKSNPESDSGIPPGGVRGREPNSEQHEAWRVCIIWALVN